MIDYKYWTMGISGLLAVAAIFVPTKKKVKPDLHFAGAVQTEEREKITTFGHVAWIGIVICSALSLLGSAAADKKSEQKNNQAQTDFIQQTNLAWKLYTEAQYHYEAETNSLGQLWEKYSQLLNLFSTNVNFPYGYRQASIGMIQSQNESDAKDHQQIRMMLDAEPTSPEKIRQSYDAEVQAQDDQRKRQLAADALASLEAQKKQSEEKQQQIEREEQQKERQAKAEILLKKFQKNVTRNEVAPVFDPAIREFNSMVNAFATDAGLKYWSDFDDTPSLRSSNLLFDGRVTNGLNHLGVGSNNLWHFSISTEGPKLLVAPNVFPGANGQLAMMDDSIAVDFVQDFYARLSVANEDAHEPSRLTITLVPERGSYSGWGFSSYFVEPRGAICPRIIVDRTLPGELNFHTNVSVMEFTNVIKRQLEIFVGRQAKVAPLKFTP